MKNRKYIFSLFSLLIICLQDAFPFERPVDIPSVYYVGGENASDNNPGTKEAPFATISAAAALLTGGDTCYIRAGVYRETVVPANSGSSAKPIVFTGYGDGDVIISGADRADGGWTVYDGKIYQKTISLPTTGYRDAITGNETLLANQVFVDGKMMIEARWPNISNSDDLMNRDDFRLLPKDGWINGTPTTLIDSGIPDIPGGWTGGTIWTMCWYVPGTSTITASSAGEIRFSLSRNEKHRANGFYYLTGRLGALDARKEWFYDGTKLYLWATDGGIPKNVEVKMRNYAFDLRGKSYITVRNLSLFAATVTTDNRSESVLLDRLRVQYNSHFVTLPGGYAIFSHSQESGIRLMGPGSAIRNSIVEYSAGHGIVLGGEGGVADNNLIHDISYAGTYSCGIYPEANLSRQTITHNTIYRTGRAGIDFSSPLDHAFSNKDIGYNDIFAFGLINTDLAAIYSGGKMQDMTGMRIHHNWLHDAANDNAHNFPVGAGIYIEHGARGAQIDHNVFWNNHKDDVRIDMANRPYHMFYNNTLASGGPDFWGSILLYRGKDTGTVPPANIQNNIYRSAIRNHTPQNSEIASETDPLFVDPSAGGLGFRLKTESPAIDHGIVIEGVTGNYKGDGPDAGAYEFNGPAWIAGAVGLEPVLITSCYDIQLEFINSSSGKPMEGLEVIFRGKKYTTNRQGIIPLFEIPDADYKIALPDTSLQLVENDILEVFSDSVIRIYVKELPQ